MPVTSLDVGFDSKKIVISFKNAQGASREWKAGNTYAVLVTVTNNSGNTILSPTLTASDIQLLGPDHKPITNVNGTPNQGFSLKTATDLLTFADVPNGSSADSPMSISVAVGLEAIIATGYKFNAKPTSLSYNVSGVAESAVDTATFDVVSQRR